MAYFANLSYLHNIGNTPLMPLTLGNLLEIAATKYSQREAIVCLQQDQRLTFKGVLQLADQFAAGLQTIGLQKGDRLGLWAPNLIEWYIICMACARSGILLALMNPASTTAEVEYYINKVAMKAIICPWKTKYLDHYDVITTIAPELKISEPGKLSSQNVPTLESVILISTTKLHGTYTYYEILKLAKDEVIDNIRSIQQLIQPDDPCHIMFTSGTTNAPKAAVISHFQLVNNAFYIAKSIELSKKYHRACVQVPFFHIYGTTPIITGSLHFGATLVIPSLTYSPRKNLKVLKEERCTIAFGTPTMYVDLINLQKQLRYSISPEIAVTGGASCSPEVFKQMKQVLCVKSVKSVYGATECCSMFHSLPIDEDENELALTVGHLAEHMESKVVDENGNIVPMGIAGELYIRGPGVMLGYWKDEERTKQTIGCDRWLRTGDRFILQPNGYGKIVGRIQEMIIRGGENIYPKEIEDLLNTHPDILEAHVIGLHHHRLGEEVCACIKLSKGAIITQKSLLEFCKEKIAHFKIPSQLLVMDDFPKTATGKIQKFLLKEQLEVLCINNNERDKNDSNNFKVLDSNIYLQPISATSVNKT